MPSETIICREFRPGDEHQIAALFEFVFARRRPLQRWCWEYAHSPARRIDATVALSGATIVGFAGAPALECNIDGRIVPAGRVQNVMVHPDFRGHHIFTRLLVLLREQMTARGVESIVTFPNDNSLPAFLRHESYQHVADVLTLTLPVARLASLPSGAATFTVDAEPSWTPEDVRFIAAGLGSARLSIHRSLEYLGWRYHPDSGHAYVVVRAHAGGRMAGLAVCKRYAPDNSVDLLELFCPADRTSVTGLLEAIREHFGAAQAQSFNLWSMPHYPLHAMLLEMGSKATRGTHLVSRSLSPALVCPTEPSHYYLSMGDSDVY